MVLGLSVALLSLASVRSFAQTVFTYTATDHRTIVMTEAGTAIIPVMTLVIIQTDAGLVRPQVPTRTFSVRFRPPAVKQPRLLQASVDNQVVDINVVGSNIDGEMEATVEIPVTSGNKPELRIYWSTQDGGALEMNLLPTPQAEKRRTLLKTTLHARKSV